MMDNGDLRSFVMKEMLKKFRLHISPFKFGKIFRSSAVKMLQRL